MFHSTVGAQAAVVRGLGRGRDPYSNVSSFAGKQALSVSIQGVEKEHHVRLLIRLGWSRVNSDFSVNLFLGPSSRFHLEQGGNFQQVVRK